MSNYQYKTIAAPRRAKKVKGVRGREAQLAITIEELIQEQAAAGWEYQRTDIFPVEEGGGWFSKDRTVNRAVLVFRRPGPGGVTAPPPPQAARTAPPVTPTRNEPEFSIAGVTPPKAPPIGGARED